MILITSGKLASPEADKEAQRAIRRGTSRHLALLGGMGDDKTYTEPSKVTAKDGDIAVDGPDGVDVKFSPEAALETSGRLLGAATKAQGQRVSRDWKPGSLSR